MCTLTIIAAASVGAVLGATVMAILAMAGRHRSRRHNGA
jgi:hypothetical protein